MTGAEKARKIVDAGAPAPYSFAELTEITITKLMVYKGLVRCVVSANRNGVPVPVNNPILLSNPPIVVVDGDSRIENPQQALMHIVGHAVMGMVAS